MNPNLKAKLLAVLAQPDLVDMNNLSCGSAHCIAGWVLTLSGYKSQDNFILGHDGKLLYNCITLTSKILGLDISITSKLYFHHNWPLDLQDRYIAGDKSSVPEALERALEGTL